MSICVQTTTAKTYFVALLNSNERSIFRTYVLQREGLATPLGFAVRKRGSKFEQHYSFVMFASLLEYSIRV